MGFDVICIGEAVASLAPRAADRVALRPGGDAATAALGFARLRPPGSVALAACFGGDPLSAMVRAALVREGVDCGLTRRAARALGPLRVEPGAFDGARARWPGVPPLRRLLTDEDRPRAERAFRDARMVYLTGAALAALSEEERDRLFSALLRARLAFDAAYDPRDWSSRADAALWIDAVYRRASVILTTPRQEAAVFGAAGGARDAGHAEIVLRNGPCPCLIARDGVWVEVAPPERLPKGGGAAAFNIGYLSARLDDRPVAVAAKTGHAVAALAIRAGAPVPDRQALAAFSPHAARA